MKIHLKTDEKYKYAECGAYFPVEYTANPQEVTCKSCRKTKEWKKAMKTITERKVGEMKTNWMVGEEKEVTGCITQDGIPDILYDEVHIIKELSPSKFVLYDSEDQEHYLLILSLILPEKIMHGLDWLVGDTIDIESTEICFDWGEVSGIILRNLTKEKEEIEKTESNSSEMILT